jgi:hypothetical protein
MAAPKPATINGFPNQMTKAQKATGIIKGSKRAQRGTVGKISLRVSFPHQPQ